MDFTAKIGDFWIRFFGKFVYNFLKEKRIVGEGKWIVEISIKLV